MTDRAPVALLAQSALARALPAEVVEALFAKYGNGGYTHKLTMSTVVDLLLQVIAGRKRSVFAAFRAASSTDGVTAQALDRKLGRVAPAFACARIKDSARRLRPAVERHHPPRPSSVLAGYRVRVLDGTQPDGSEHRLGVLRQVAACGLPCRLVVRYDPAPRLCDADEDAYEAEAAIARSCWGGPSRANCTSPTGATAWATSSAPSSGAGPTS
ncbi:MAG: hypothetical protein IRY99_02425 [Isosphaeraceae bacterium]|nr:hypothetical protein [Isosphaeraceae bacterium]